MKSSSRPFWIAVGLGTLAQAGLGLLINLVSAYPLYDKASTGTLGDPLPMQAVFLTVGGLLSVVIDFIVAYRLASVIGQGGLGPAGAATLAHAIGGFINAVTAWMVLLGIYSILQSQLGSSVSGLGESYHALMLLIASVGLLVGWVIGLFVAVVAGSIGGYVEVGRAKKA
jgi:hypothetical protein